VDFLLQRARRSDLSKEERQKISAEVNQLWTKLASMNHTRSEETLPAQQTESSDQAEQSDSSDDTVRFVM
jgi:hypothetical protein